MMPGDILFIAHRMPYPPDRGDKIRSWHILKALADHATVHVAALVDDKRDWQHQHVLEDLADSVLLEPRRTSKAAAAARALITGQSASVAAFWNAALHRRIMRLLASRKIGSILVFSGQMAQYVPESRSFVMDFVDMDSAKFDLYARQGQGLSAWANGKEAGRLFAFECKTARRAQKSLFVSEAEAALFRAKSGLDANTVGVLENGIDLDRFDPSQTYAAPLNKTGPMIVFTGQMDYRPNIDAVSAFARETLPLIQQHADAAQFAIVGRAPTAEVLALAQLPGVIVTGEVPDTRGWLAAADVLVAPLKLARGIQNKVLEAMAMAKPVVLSSAAAEGIDASAFVIADHAADAAQAVLDLIRSPEKARNLGQAARARMVERYSWGARLAGLPALMGLT